MNQTAPAIQTHSRGAIGQFADVDRWRTLEVLGVYRLSLCGLLLLLARAPSPPGDIGATSLPLFLAGAHAYLLIAAVALVLLRLRRPSDFWQAAFGISADLILLLTLIEASGGATSGLGLLLITPVSAAAIIFERRIAVSVAAIASLSLLGLEVYRQLSGSGFTPAYTQAGLLGLVAFIIAWSASALASRARDSEALALRVGSDLVKLSRLNETIIQKLDAGVVVIDASGRVQLQNTAADALIGAHDRRLLPDREPDLWRYLSEWLRTPERISATTLTTATGRQVMPQFTRLGQGDAAATLVVLEDASRLAEAAQQHKLASLGRLTASIAHEIRNPLAAIRQAGQLLAESSEASPQDRQMLEIVERQTERINKIVKDILGLTRNNENERQTIELVDFIRRKRHEFIQTLEARVPRLNINDSDQTILVRFDPLHLEQVLFNLWENACAHGWPDDDELEITVTITLNDGDNNAVISIQDNGPGIPEAARRQIFEPFFSTSHQGTGLGLYIAHELCAANGAKLQAPATDRGALFHILAPASAAVKEAS